MGHTCNYILLQIQEKREKMIYSAKKNGYTSEDTIRCSQELDQLIYEYQLLIYSIKKQEKEALFPLNKMRHVMQEEITDPRNRIMSQ